VEKSNAPNQKNGTKFATLDESLLQKSASKPVQKI
jgi:hypothetical protein